MSKAADGSVPQLGRRPRILECLALSRFLRWRARMGNPLRFFGAPEPYEIDGVVIPANCAVEVTFRCHQERHLLRPDDVATEIIGGCFGRAYDRYPELQLVVAAFLSNHGQYIAMPPSAFVLSSFMRDFLSTAARKLNGHRGRKGTFWERRYRPIPILDERAFDDRFAYVLTQGTKENLVWNARDWRGFSSVQTLLEGKPLIGRWRDESTESELRRRRRRKLDRAANRDRQISVPPVQPVFIEYPIEHVPMPHWQDLSPNERRARVAAILRSDTNETRKRHHEAGTRPLGARAAQRVDPFSRPANPKRSPAPRCHTKTPALRKAFGKLAKAFEESAREGVERLRGLLVYAKLPDGAAAPFMWCPARASGPPGTGPPKQR